MIDVALHDVLMEDIELLEVLEVIFQMLKESGPLTLSISLHESAEIARLSSNPNRVRTVAEESLN